MNRISPGFDTGKRIRAVAVAQDRLCRTVRSKPHNCHSSDTALSRILVTVPVHIFKNHTGNRAFGDIPEIGTRGPRASDRDGHGVGRGTDESFRVTLPDSVCPGRGVTETVGAVHHGRDLFHGFPLAADQREDCTGYPGFAGIPRAVSVRVLKHGSGNFALGNVSEIDICRRAALHPDGPFVGGGAGKAIRIGLFNRVLADGDVGKGIGTVIHGERYGHLGISGIFQRHSDPADSGFAVTPVPVAVRVFKNHSGNHALSDICEVCCSGTGFADIQSNRIRRDTRVSFGVCLPDRAGYPCRDAGKGIGSVACCDSASGVSVSVSQFYGDARDASLAGPPGAVTVKVIKDRAGNRALGNVRKIGDRRAAACHGDRFRVGCDAGISRGISLLHRVSSGDGPGKEIGPVHPCHVGACNPGIGRVLLSLPKHQFHGHARDADFLLIPGTVAVQVLKNSSGNRTFGHVPEIDSGGASAFHRDRNLIRRGAGKSGRVSFPDGVNSRVGPGKAVGTVSRCHDFIDGSCGINPCHGHAADAGFTRIPLAVAVQVVKYQTGHGPFYQIRKARCSGPVAADADRNRVGRDAGIPRGIALLDRVKPRIDAGKGICAVSRGHGFVQVTAFAV